MSVMILTHIVGEQWFWLFSQIKIKKELKKLNYSYLSKSVCRGVQSVLFTTVGARDQTQIKLKHFFPIELS